MANNKLILDSIIAPFLTLRHAMAVKFGSILAIVLDEDPGPEICSRFL